MPRTTGSRTAAIEVVFSGAGAVIMAVAIMVSTFGCNNGLILAGARVYYAMARDGLFFKAVGRLNARSVPAAGLVLQCVWTCLLVLPRTRSHDAGYRPRTVWQSLQHPARLRGLRRIDLLRAHHRGVFVLRRKRPDAERPYRAFGYPVVPALYIVAASAIMLVLLCYQTKTSWPGLVIVLLGVPVYFLWKAPAAMSMADGS